jgi:signal transduction histidine kinase
MEDLSLHVLDIVQNSIAASAKRIEILVAEDTERDILSIEISDDGNGMDAEALERARDPFYTTKTTRRVGLGVPLLAQAARECNGKFQITSEPGSGTTIKASFRRSHPDRKPLGDMLETIRMIVAASPNLELRYEHRIDDSVYRFDTKDMSRNEARGPI